MKSMKSFFLVVILVFTGIVPSMAQSAHKGTKYSYIDPDENRFEFTIKKDSYWIMYLPKIKEDADLGFSSVKPYRYQVTLEEYNQLLDLFDGAINAKKEHARNEDRGSWTLYYGDGKEGKFKLKPKSKSKLMIDDKLIKLKEKYKDKLVMIETKLSYTYVDGNGNAYTLISQFQKSKIGYEPITREMSSSGEYSGGEPYEHRILFEEYLELGSLLETAFSTTDQHTISRSKGTGLITLEGSAGRSCILKFESDLKKQIEWKFQQFKKRYIDLDSSLAIAIKGKIVERPFVSKKGVVADVKEYYFIPNDEEIKNRQLETEYFIKISKGGIKKDDLKLLVNQEKVFSTTQCWGLWDSDDNTQQSRVGSYIVLFSHKW